MARNQLIYPADLAQYKDCGYCGTPSTDVPDAGQKPNCNCMPFPYIPMPPKDLPPFPPFPPYPYPCDCDHNCKPDEEPKKTSIEGQICKLSRKAAAINKMIDYVENKKKDVIIKVGGVSYNFANIDMEVKEWEDGSYAATTLKMLQHERALIMAEIKELSDKLDDEVTEDTSMYGTDGGNL